MRGSLFFWQRGRQHSLTRQSPRPHHSSANDQAPVPHKHLIAFFSQSSSRGLLGAVVYGTCGTTKESETSAKKTQNSATPSWRGPRRAPCFCCSGGCSWWRACGCSQVRVAGGGELLAGRDGEQQQVQHLQQVIGVHLLSAPLLLPPITQPQCRHAVYIGIFDPEKFRVALIDLQPQLGERKRNAEAAATQRTQRPRRGAHAPCSRAARRVSRAVSLLASLACASAFAGSCSVALHAAAVGK